MQQQAIEQEFDLKTLYYSIANRKWVVFTVMVALVTIVAINCALTKPVYRATTQILIEKEPIKEVYKESVGMDLTAQDYYQTQYVIIKSRSLAKMVIDELNLSKHEEFKGCKDIVSAFLKGVYVDPVKNTRIVSLSVESHDPQLSTEMANTLARVYIQHNLEARGFISKDIMEKISSDGFKEGQAKTTETIPSIIGDSLISRLRANYVEQEAQLANFSKRYKDKHPKIAGLKASLALLKQKIGVETQRVLDSVKVELSGMLKGNNIRIVDSAEVPQKPVKPRTKLNITLAAIVGLCMGSALAFLLDYMNATLYAPEDVEAITKAPLLGHVPKIKLEERHTTIDYAKEKVAQIEPQSLASEAFKVIRTGLVFSAPQKSMKVLLVTSSSPQDGKTLTAINIAISLGQVGSRVILVDADMRQPKIHKPFGIDLHNGLSEYLLNGGELDSVIRQTDVENLHIITAGVIPQNPAELLGAEKMRTLIAQLRAKFDRVIIDTTPLITITDALILANMVDGVIYVVRADVTTKSNIQRGIKKLASIKVDVAGIVLNNINLSKHGYGYLYYDYYYAEGQSRRKRSRLAKSFEKVEVK